MVYFIKALNLYKIGYTQDMDQRMTAYKTHNPFVEWVYYTEGTEKLETRLLHKYKKYRQRGEWFNFPISVVNDLLVFFSTKYTYEKPVITYNDVLSAIQQSAVTDVIKTSKWFNVAKVITETANKEDPLFFDKLNEALLTGAEYTYTELEKVFKPIFNQKGIEWSKHTSIRLYFPHHKKKRKTIKCVKETVYTFYKSPY